MSEDELNELLGLAGDAPVQEAPSRSEPVPPQAPPAADDGDSLEDFMSGAGLQVERTVPDITKPWMKHHKFELVSSLAKLREIVDAALVAGHCALDLETEGLDNRIYHREDGSPYTVHQIVGFCLSYDGLTGYYVPVRHAPEDGGTNLNLPVKEAEAEIARLCRASQPTGTPESIEKDPLSPKDFATPPKVVLYFWNAKFDQEFLYPITGIDWWHPESFEDGNLAFFTYFSGDKGLSLKDKAKLLRDPDGNPYEMIKLKELFVTGRRDIKFALLAPDEPGCVKYACSDAICTFLLCTPPRKHERERVDVLTIVKSKYNFTYRLEKQTSQAVRWMERPRVRVNRDKVNKIRLENAAKRDGVLKQIYALAHAKGFHGFEPGSSKQLGEFLFGEQGLNITLPVDNQDFPRGKPQRNEKSGQYKTDADTLERLLDEHPSPPDILKWIVEWRTFEKLDGTYLQSMVNNIDQNSEMRFQFKQTGAATGRFSAPAGEADQGFSGIPVHGIPGTSALRQAFEAREGFSMCKCDYAGQELRVAANVSGEEVWIKEFLEGTGDLHSITARAFFNKKDVSKEERKMGKIANFALVYGGGPAAIMRATGCDKLEGTRRKQAFDKSVPTFAKWIKGQHAFVKKAKGVWTALGRWIAIPDIDNEDRVIQSACERHSTNYPIQGCLNRYSLVLTDAGYKTIGDLEAHGSAGLHVWTGTQWATFTAHNMGRWQLADITLADGTLIQCDTRHKLLVITDEGYSWVEYADLKSTDCVATSLCEPLEMAPPPLPLIEAQPRARNSFVVVPSSLADLWYWLGRYMGDGWIDADRGGIVYAFGQHEQKAIDACVAFWQSCGLNPQVTWATHTPAEKTSTRARVEIWGVDLTRWLETLGFSQATAHTKRLPARIFQETLAHRRSFMCGFMDSDGCRPSVETAKGNPYNLHLCQRELLTDTKLLLRTMGVESSLRGPYQSTNQRNGVQTTSYRLDIQRRMFERNVMGRTDLRHAKFHDMFAPAFLVQNLLSKGAWVRKDFPEESLYNMYLRLKAGGKVSVYTLDRMCKTLGVTLDHPIYGFKRLVSKADRAEEEDTFTLSVNDSLHRFDADGVITKNSGADIMKISLVLLCKEFYRRGWLKQGGGSDSVRMLLTVHDEIVFEIKHELVQEALAIIVKKMASPTFMAGPPHSPKWRVPLVVEPLIGQNWGGEYDWGMLHHGRPYEKGDKLKDLDVLIGDRVYHKVPPWLDGLFVPPYLSKGEAATTPSPALESPPQAVVETTPPAVAATMPSPPQEPEQAPMAALVASESSVPPSSPSPDPKVDVGPIFSVKINILAGKRTVKQVRAACAEAYDPDGRIVCILDGQTGAELVEPSRGIRVVPEDLVRRLRDINLSDGVIYPYVRAGETA